MSQTSDHYRRLAEQFTQKVAAVPDHAWNNQSPCPDWNTRDVVRHVVDSSCHFLSWVNHNVDSPSVDDDPMGAWCAVRDIVQESLDDPSIAQTILDRPMATGPFEEFVENYLIFDLVVHAWDLSSAAGIDDSLAPDTVAMAGARAEQMVDMGRKMGAFGPEVNLAENADEQTRLLALVGRRR